MKRFLIKLGITVLALFAAACGLDFIITYNLRHSDARMFDTYNAITDGRMQDVNVLIMGSSRGQVQYSPRVIDSITGLNSYNISVDGRCIDAEVTMYHCYRMHHPAPKVIIQNIDWGTLLMSNGYEREQYLPYLRNKSLYSEIGGREGFSWADRLLPLWRYAGYHEVMKEGLGLSAKMARPAMDKGYVAREESWDGTAFRQIDTLGFSVNCDAVDIFDNYLAWCKKEGVLVVMVYAPFYIGATRKMGPGVEAMFACYRSFADKYGYPILNYTYDKLSYDTLNFYNASHMNRRGAERFSVKLAHDLDSLLSLADY